MVYEIIELTWHGFETSRICNGDETLHQDGVFLVIPIGQNDGEFFVVLVRFVRRMQEKGRTKAIDILALI